jgi:hypothetical protein
MWPRFSAKDYRRPIDSTEYILNWCDNCGFGRLDGKLTPDIVRPFYDIEYYTHQPVSVVAVVRRSGSALEAIWHRDWIMERIFNGAIIKGPVADLWFQDF